DHYWFNDKYETDERQGVCLDDIAGDGNFIRYVNCQHGNKVFKMKAGKFYKYLLLQTEIGKALPQQVLVWVLEELTYEWKTYVAERVPKYTLRIDDNFEKIYNSYHCPGDFGSCMAGESQHYFYEDAVQAKASYLEDEDGKVVARCILFPNVQDEDGKIWRLAERQYSRNGDAILKQLLVNALIKEGAIDGYKAITASCGDSRAFIDLEGNSLSDKEFSIDCHLEHGDTLSYQDSFKYFLPQEGRAYNRWQDDCDDDDRLDTTDCEFYGSLREWDSYHERYCRDVVGVYHENEYLTCDEEDLEDFQNYGGSWYHKDDLLVCPKCGGYFLDPCYYGSSESEYSELLEEDFCCEDCRNDAENEYKEENWFWSDFDEDYVESKEMLTEYLHFVDGRYIVQKVCKDNVNKYLQLRWLFMHNGVLVDDAQKMLQDDRASEALEQVYAELLQN
ncbi:MAG: hypothetical protein II630_10020, partial [Bacteroidales bacterium]|nr:hypothetical protein [Bacteroidales bacterium]